MGINVKDTVKISLIREKSRKKLQISVRDMQQIALLSVFATMRSIYYNHSFHLSVHMKQPQEALRGFS
jgi:hypothetical protein